MDDEEFCISAMKSYLFALGIPVESQVDFCINGQEAIDQIKNAYKFGISYKIILTDFSMPVKNGIEATRDIRKFFGSVNVLRENQPKIIGITGHVLDNFTE